MRIHQAKKEGFRIWFGNQSGIRFLGLVLFFWIFSRKAKVTLTMKRVILLSKTTITAIWDRMEEFLSPRILGFKRIEKSFLTVEFNLSEAGRSALSL